MNRNILIAVLLCMVLLAGCSEPQYTDMSSLASATPQGSMEMNVVEDSLEPSASMEPSPTPANAAGGTMEGLLTDAEVEDIISRVDQVVIDDTDIPYLNQIVLDLQPIMDAFQDLTAAMSTTDLENEEWVQEVSGYAATLEAACDEAIKADYGEHLADLEQLLNAGYDSFKKGAASIKEAVTEKDMEKMTDATAWLMLGIDYETKASEYLQVVSTSGSPDASTQPSESPTSTPSE